MADNKPLFPEKDPYGLGNSVNSLFTSDKPMRVAASSGAKDADAIIKAASKAPTKKQLAEQEAARQAAFYDGVRTQLNAMRETPEWANASYDRRVEMKDTWMNDKYKPFVSQYQDPQIRMQLNSLVRETLDQDIKNLGASKDESSWFADTAIGTNVNARKMESSVNDLLPLSRYQMVHDDLKNILAEGREPTAWEKYVVLGPAREIYNDTGDWNKTLTEIESRMGTFMGQNKVTRDKVAELEKDYSIDKADKDIRAEEFKQESGAIMGTLRNLADNGGGNLLREVVEQAPTIVPTVLAARGGILPVTAAGAGMSAQDSVGTVFDQVMAIPQDVLEQAEPYRQLVDEGTDPDTARQTLAARAASGAIPMAALWGAAMGPIGPEAAVARALGTPVKGAATSVTSTVGRGLAKTGVASLSGATDNAMTQLSANLSQQDNVGANTVGTFDNVAEAGTLGFALGAALGGPSEVVSGIRERGAATTDESGTASGTTDQVTEGSINEVMDIPSAAAAAEESGLAGAEAPATSAAEGASPETVAKLQEAFSSLRDKAGQTLTLEEATPAFEMFYDAQENGVSADAVNRGLNAVNDVRAMDTSSPFATLEQAFADYSAKRSAADINAMAETAAVADATQNPVGESTVTEVATNEQTGTGTVETGRAEESAGTGPAINSGVETTTAGSEPVTTSTINTLIQDGGSTQNAEAGRPAGDTAQQGQGNAGNDAALGDAGVTGATVSRPDNSADASSAAQLSAGKRGGTGTAGQGAADGGSLTGTGSSTAGVNQQLTAGQQVEYQGAFANAPVLRGTVERVNADGSFDLRSNGVVSGNLPQSGIRSPAQAPAAAPAVSAAEPAQLAPAAETAGVSEQAVSPVAEAGPAVTPDGREVSYVQQATEALYDVQDGKYSSDALALERALADGDAVTVDNISSYLYSQGLRQFAPPNRATGRARDMFVQQMETLTTQDRAVLRNEYDSLHDSLPYELRDHDAFVNAMVQDALLETKGASPLTAAYRRLTKFARDVIGKIAKGIAAVALVLTLSNTFPVNDAVAASGMGTVTTVTQTQGFTPAANAVNSWVTQTKDSGGKKYIIADKASGEIHIMNADGTLAATAPALYGRQSGDGMAVGETPAGIFKLHQERAPASYGGDAHDFATAPNGDVYSLHRVLTGNPKQNRLGRLASKSADDNRISLGCINIPADVYNQYLSKGFDGKLYILPDQKKLGEVFKGIEEVEARQDLRDGVQLPEDFQSPTTDAYQSSTVIRAEADRAAPAPVDGSSLTVEAADMDMGISQSGMAATSNEASESGMASLAILPLFAMLRNRTRKANGDRMGDADPSDVGGTDQTNPDLGPNKVNGNNRHTVRGTDRGASDASPQSTADWLTNVTVKAAERISNSARRFEDWTGQFVERGHEKDTNDVFMSFKLASNVTRQIQHRYSTTHLKPLSDMLVKVSSRMGRPVDVVGDHFGIWATTQHIPEANAELRRKLVERVNETMFTDPVQYAEAAEALSKHDSYQRGVGDPAPMAGGLTDAQAKAIAERIQSYGYNLEELQAFQQSIVKSFDTLLNERVEAGIVTEEQARSWREDTGFQNYVPLYVDKSTEQGSDIFVGSSMYNPAGDHARNGSLTPANHSLVTLHQYMSRTAAGIAMQPFKARLHALYTKLKAEGDTRGLRRVNMADPYLSEKDRGAAGMMYRDPFMTEEGTEGMRTYKYLWDDAAIAEGIFKSVGETNPAVMRGLAAVTNIHARVITKYDPSFAIRNWPRDGWERATSIAAKELFDARTGKSIPLMTVARKVYLSAFNPVNIAILAANTMNPSAFADSRIIKSRNMLKELGGLTTYNDALAMNAKNMRAELKRQKGLRKHAGILDNFFTQWNEAFSEAPAAGVFQALVDMGVSAQEAAFRTLDTFNTNNRGAWTGTMKAMTPFVVPAIEGGRNMVRNLSAGPDGKTLSRGRKLFIGQVAMAMALYGAVRAFAPDDPEKGNALDAMKLTEFARFIPLYNKDGSYAKLPVSFGMSRLAWIMGAGMVRMQTGAYDNAAQGAGDILSNVALAGLQEMQPFDFAKDVYADNFATGFILSVVPAIAQPFAEAGMNINHFGGMIHGTTPAGGFASDSARAKTAEVWTDIAVTMQKTFGIDAYPETYRHLINGYAVGPARAITTMLEADSNYTSGGRLRTRQEIGPVWDAVGIAQFYDNGVSSTERQFYNQLDTYYDTLKKYHVAPTDPDNKPGTKAISAYNRMLEAGSTEAEAQLVYNSINAETAREKLNKQLREQVKQYKRADIDLKELAPAYEAHADAMDMLMRDYIGATRGTLK